MAAEVTPFAKTGGLGDVTGALTAHLVAGGHDARTFLPLYGRIDRARYGLVPVDFVRDAELPLGPRSYRFSAWTGRLPGSPGWVYFIDCPALYGGPEIYRGDDADPVRFAFLGAAVLATCQRMGWSPQVFHLHDWHAAPTLLLARTVFGWDGLFRDSRALLTLHNAGFQGETGSGRLADLGLADHHGILRGEDLAAGKVNLLAAAIVHADLLSTVSPTHAREIQTAEYGAGLDGLLRWRADRLLGIVNGIDTAVWNPEADPYTAAPFSATDPAGKETCKRDLLTELGLPYATAPPVVGVVSRLTWQKGFDLLAGPGSELLRRHDLRLAMLGSGEPEQEALLAELQRRFPARAVFYRGFSEVLAHKIVAGSDLLLMPSRYEPCGLTQMYAQRYGTLPVVRRTGGLADTVVPYDPATGEGTGFAFEHFTADGLTWALEQALAAWREPAVRRRLIARAMAEDHSWARRGGEYVALYRRLVAGA